MYSNGVERLVLAVLSATVLCVALTVAQRSPECIKYEVHEFLHTNPSQVQSLTDNCYSTGGFLDSETRARFPQPGPLKFNTTFECCANRTCQTDLDCPFNFLCNVNQKRCVVATCELTDEVDLILNEGQDCDIDDDCAFSVPGDASNWKCIAAPCPGSNCISRDKCKRCSKALPSRLLPSETDVTTIDTLGESSERPTTNSSELRATEEPFTTRGPVMRSTTSSVEAVTTMAEELNNSIPDTSAPTTAIPDLTTEIATTEDNSAVATHSSDLFTTTVSSDNHTTSSNSNEEHSSSTETAENTTENGVSETTTTATVVSDRIVNSGTLMIPLIRPSATGGS